jgi:predicted enzyme related to lactoylglutathione lyase
MIGIAAILIHVSDWREATDWYERAFPDAVRAKPDPADYGFLRLSGVTIELVEADDQVRSGASGSVVYWSVQDFNVALKHFQDIGAKLYRGPLVIEDGKRMCQVLDPWGNCIGLRG